MNLSAAERIDTWIPVGFFVILWALMQWYKKLPSPDSIQKFVAVINSRGGNIVILTCSSIYFFRYSMYLFMNLLEMVKNKTISEDNAFALMAIQFITTSAFGGSMGALLKTMTGESSTARSTDGPGNGNGNGKSLLITPGQPIVTAQPTTPLGEKNDASSASTTQGTAEISSEKSQLPVKIAVK
jgi:hypothetical protein